MTLKYRLTGQVPTNGFAEFLQKELNKGRRNIQLFKSELEEKLGFTYATLVNSGSSANLVAALMTRELKPGKNKILLSGFSFPTTISSFKLLGYKVQLIDVDTFNMDADSLEKYIDNDTAAVVPTHFLGFPANLEKIRKHCDSYGALLIQDACETMNLKVNNKLLYEYGDIITHSFYHPHHTSSFGGGAVVVKNPELYDLAESVSHWGRACKCHYDKDRCDAPEGMNHNFWYERLGVNVEMSELNACFGRFYFQEWEKLEQVRKERYADLFEALKDSKAIIYKADFNCSPFVFPIGVNNLSEAASAIQQRGVEIRTLMGGAMHNHPAFKHLKHDDLKNTERIGSSHFFVGIHQTIPEEDHYKVKKIVSEILHGMA